MINSPVCNFVFTKTSKPFRGDYLSANKQYIAPLPIPRATAAEKKLAGQCAKKLQTLHTARRDKTALLRRRLGADQCVDDRRAPEWIWADVGTVASLKETAPETVSALPAREKTAWAKREHEARLAARLEAVAETLRPGSRLAVDVLDGEVRFLADSAPVLSVYADGEEAPFIAAQWRLVAGTTAVTGNFQAKKLVSALLALRTTNQPALRKQILRIDADMQALEKKIAAAEEEMNALAYRLYALSPDEIALIEGKNDRRIPF